MSYRTASALLKSIWLIESGYAKAQLPLVTRMITGEQVDTSSLFQTNDHVKSSLPIRTKIAASKTDVFSMRPYSSTDRLPFGSIAMVDVIGPVLKYGDSCSYGSVDTEQLIARLGNSERVAGIILNVDSPGGQADGTAMVGQTIRDVIAQKPVIAIIQDGMAASAGYWIASQAQEVYVTHTTTKVGSIGAYTTYYDLSGLLEKAGVKQHEIYAPQSTDKNKDYYDVIERGDDTAVKADLKVLVDDFTKAVKTARGARLNTKDENPFTGKMYFADEAKKIGLIDGVKSFGQVVQRMESLIKLRA